MKITNIREVEQQIALEMGRRLQAAMNAQVYEIIMELPQGYASSISDQLYAEQVSPTEYRLMASDIWTYLNDGTGLYGPHKGAGPGGEIVPLKAKALHFRSKAIAQALGFENDEVFLKSVKGIKPRFYWERHFTEGRLLEGMAKA